MREITFMALLVLWLTSCAGGGKKTEVAQKPPSPSVNLDSTEMAETIHRFFKWYGETGEQLITKIDFVNTTAKHPTLDLSILAKYFGEFLKSGAVSTEFIQNETIFYRACALAWADENAEDMITGFDVDRYYCQQDGDVREFLTAGIAYKMEGEYAKVQLMLDPKGPNGGPRDFEMKKENGKWLLSKNGCSGTLQN